METRGIIMFNRGDSCIIRATVCLYSLRKHYDGPVTFYLEDPYPHEFDDVCKHFNCDIIHNEKNHDLKTLVRKTTMFQNPPYDRTLWLDLDTVIVGKLDEMFDYLDDDVDCSIPHFCGWLSTGNKISGRIKRFNGIAEQRYVEEALKEHPAVNTGILAFRKSDRWTEFVEDWVALAHEEGGFIADEIAFQVLYPSADEWGLKIHIAPTDFNVSVLHDKGLSKDPRVIHYHGKKSVLDVPLCDIFKSTFDEMYRKNEANIRSLIEYDHKRTKAYIKTYLQNFKEDSPQKEITKVDIIELSVEEPVLEENIDAMNDVTVVTACDEKYVDFLKITFPNWRKYKNIDNYPVIVFVHGMDKEDVRLDFLKLPNVTIIPWSMDNADDHREEMLSAFVFGSAEHVKTDYWLKLDADSYATDNRPIITSDMKEYAFCGHKWGYSKPEHIKKLDEWASTHGKKKLRRAGPMLENGGRVDGSRFYHNTKRTISFVQLHRTRFTKFCVGLLTERKLPAPTQDTFMFYVANRFNPESVGFRHFKKEHGFTQGNSRRGVEELVQRINDVEKANQ